MKYLKMVGLAVVAAAALTAFASAGTASATVLCHSTSTPCTEKWGLGTEVLFTVKPGTSGVWSSTTGEQIATCPEGEIRGNISAVGSSSETVKLPVEKSHFVWKSCIETNTLEGGFLEVHTIAGTDNGTVTATGFKFTTVVSGIDCVYGFAEAGSLGTLTSSGTGSAVLDINTFFVKREGSILCPSNLTWAEEFTQTAPGKTPVYVEPS